VVIGGFHATLCPEEVARFPGSYTGQYLREKLL